ncbi:ATP-binding protein [Gillisia sp. CAL575]|uniref:ATP-binding protein n=1 Tax=Gillisia sp. CAL575 TaxID=985255 RepID=UPI0003A31776|nr:ATP-binding protein [Gillisia sp. CAL575]
MISTNSKIVLSSTSPEVESVSNIQPLITKQLFWKLFRLQAPHFIIKPENKEIIYSIFRYFLQLPNFNEYGVIKNKADLEKGLLVYGDYGVGKSTLLNAIHEVGRTIVSKTQNTQLWFPRISTVHMLSQYYESQKNLGSNFKLENYYQGKLYLDDLGKEDKAYNREELIGKLLFERHHRKFKTFVTTNDNPSAITARYGNHIGDRLPEMFNIIKWEGKSWRE